MRPAPTPTPLTSTSEVVRLAARGDGVTADGHFVPLAAPGDRVRFGPSGHEVIPGPRRAAPVCQHFPECGACHLQHVDEETYRAWMTERIAAALAQAGVSAGLFMPPHLSPPRSRRRAALKAVRVAGGVTIGFHVEGTHRVLDLRECHVLRPELFDLIEPLRALLGEVLPRGQGAGLTLTLTETGIDVLLANVAAETGAQRARLAAFAETADLARLSVETSAGVEPVAIRRTPIVRLGGVAVEVPPAPFLQATEDGEAALTAAVLDAAKGARRVADLFAGLGTFALPLAQAGARVLAADASGPAIAALKRAGAGLPIETAHRDLFRRPFRPDELARTEAVVFDPPRAGAREQATELARANVPVIIAVSCNPATFARDAALLAGGGYAMGRLWPIGQFRWSNHVELVAEFRRA